MQITVIQEKEHLHGLRRPWNDLLLRCPLPSVYLTWEWLFTWWEVFGDASRQLHILLVHDTHGKLKAIAPFLIHQKTVARMMMCNVLEFLGTGEEEQDEVCSNYLDVMAEGTEELVFNAIVQYLREGLEQGKWHQISLRGLSRQSPLYALLTDPRQVRYNGVSLSIHTHPAACAVIHLPAEWTEYMTGLSKKWRDQIKRGRKELADLGAIDCRNITDLKELPQAFAAFQDLHQRKWASQGRAGLFASEKFSSFHKRIIQLFGENRWAAVRHLLFCGRLVAASYNFQFQKNVYFYLPAYDPDFKTKIGLGLIERSFDIEAAIQEGNKVYDFYKAKAGNYKWHLAKDQREVVDLVVSKKDIVFFVLSQLRFMKAAARKVKRLCLGNPRSS